MDLEASGEAPAALRERPETPSALTFWWRAFQDLTSARPIGFGGVGPIPWTAIDAWATRHGVTDPDDFERLASVVQALDAEHLALIEASRPK